MSARTACGWWKLPMRFLPVERLTPVLPPMEESTWAEEGGGDLDVADATHVDGGEEAGDVADWTPPPKARRRESRSAACGGELLGKGFDGGETLVAFAGGVEEDGWGFLKLARKGFDQRAQMLGEVMTKGRKGFLC